MGLHGLDLFKCKLGITFKTNFLLFKSGRSEFVPCSTSDLFSNNIPVSEPKGQENLIFKEEPPTQFNPNPLNLGKETFNNFTRYQLKNLQ